WPSVSRATWPSRATCCSAISPDAPRTRPTPTACRAGSTSANRAIWTCWPGRGGGSTCGGRRTCTCCRARTRSSTGSREPGRCRCCKHCPTTCGSGSPASTAQRFGRRTRPAATAPCCRSRGCSWSRPGNTTPHSQQKKCQQHEVASRPGHLDGELSEEELKKVLEYVDFLKHQN